MRITGKIQSFTPVESGVSQSGVEWKRRTVVIDASYITETGDDIEIGFVADTFKDFSDEQLTEWRDKGTKLAFYIFFKARQYEGKYYQDVALTNIREASPA